MTPKHLSALVALVMGTAAAGGCSSKSDVGPVAPPPDASTDTAAPPPADDAAAPPPAQDAGPKVPFVPHPDPDSIPLFDDSKVIDVALEFAAGDYEKMLAPTGTGDLRYAPCKVTFLGKTADAACRRKGDPLDWPQEKKPQIVVKFNLANPAGRFYGMRHLNLEYFAGADAPIRDRLGMWVMREAGLDASRVNHARVTKNGALLGLYMNIEVVDHEFLEDHWGPEGDGNLWESGFQLKTNDTTGTTAKLDALDSLVSKEPLTGDHSAFFAKLPTMIDVKEFLREMAAETVVLVDDNFSNGSTNFYYYEHPSRGFLVIVWDLDTILTTPVTSDPFAFWYKSDPNKLRQLMNQNTAWNTEFVDDVVEIRDKHLARIGAETDRVCTQIAAAVAEDPNKNASVAAFQADCAAFKTRATERIAFLKTSLGR